MWVSQGSQVKILNLLDCHFRIWIGQWNWGCLEDCSQGFVWGFQYCSSCSERFNKLQPNLEYFEGAWLSELSSCSQLVGWLDLHLLIARIVFSWTVMRTCCRLAGENYRVVVLLDTKFPSHLLTNLFWFHLVVLLYPYRAHCLHLVWMKNCFNLNRPSCHLRSNLFQVKDFPYYSQTEALQLRQHILAVCLARLRTQEVTDLP